MTTQNNNSNSEPHESASDSAGAIFRKMTPKLCNLRETERALRAAKRARRRQFKELCELRKLYRSTNVAVPKDMEEKIESLRYFCNFEER